MKNFYLLFSVIFILLLPSFVISQCNAPDDYAALRALYLSTNGDSWDIKDNWPDKDYFTSHILPNEIPEMSNWFGVTCEGQRIVEVDLEFNSLQGIIPSEISGLSEITVLRLADNAISGSIPVELGMLSKLESMRLNSNLLTGKIPPELAQLKSLSFLSLSNNDLDQCYPLGLYPLARQLGSSGNNSRLSNGNNFLSSWVEFRDAHAGECCVEGENVWSGKGDGSTWEDSDNWSKGHEPGICEQAVLVNMPNEGISIESATAIAGMIDIQDAENLHIKVGSKLTINGINGPIEPIVKDLNGLVQKGPFVTGSSITLNELNTSFIPTGRVYNSTTNLDNGAYDFEGIEFSSPYVNLTAEGFYFNEVKNQNSNAPLTLRGLTNIVDNEQLNINVVSTLERERVEYLIDQGVSFIEAKRQAFGEVLAIFEIEDENILSEELSISDSGDANGKMLAISLILQGYLSVGDLSELIGLISNDIKADGILDNEDIGSQLVFNARRIRLAEIRNNLESKYASLGIVNTVIPPFEPYVQQFINNTSFIYKSFIEYPETGIQSSNLIGPSLTEAPFGEYSIAAEIPEGSELRIRIYSSNVGVFFGQNDPGLEFGERNDVVPGTWYELVSSRTGLLDLRVNLSAASPDFPIFDFLKIEIFENDDVEPTITRIIELPDVIPEIVYRDGDCGPNILKNSFSPSSQGMPAWPYSLQAFMVEGSDIRVEVSGEFWTFDQTQSNTGWTFQEIDNESNTWEFKSIDNFISAEGFREIDICIDLLPNAVISDTPSVLVKYFVNGVTPPFQKRFFIIEEF